jgi:hypothetical protein
MAGTGSPFRGAFFSGVRSGDALLKQGLGARRMMRGAGSTPPAFAGAGLDHLTEGNGAPAGATSLVGRPLAGLPRLPALHPASLALRGACFGGFAPQVFTRDTGSRTALPGTWLRRALPGFACPSPASSSQGGHDADRAETPEPPGSGVTTPARRHRTLSRSQGVPLGAPLVGEGKGEYKPIVNLSQAL